MSVFQDFRFYLCRLFIPGDRTQRNFDDDIFSGPARTVIAAAGFSVLGQDVFIITQVQEGPEVLAASQDDMGSTPTVTPVGTAAGNELLPAPRDGAWPTMAAF